MLGKNNEVNLQVLKLKEIFKNSDDYTIVDLLKIEDVVKKNILKFDDKTLENLILNDKKSLINNINNLYKELLKEDIHLESFLFGDNNEFKQGSVPFYEYSGLISIFSLFGYSYNISYNEVEDNGVLKLYSPSNSMIINCDFLGVLYCDDYRTRYLDMVDFNTVKVFKK